MFTDEETEAQTLTELAEGQHGNETLKQEFAFKAGGLDFLKNRNHIH